MWHNCKHGKDGFCCQCRYGERSHINRSEEYRDSVDDLNIPTGYRLIRGFNLLREDYECW